MVKLTNETVRTLPAKGNDVLYPDDGCENLYLRVRAAGSRTYVIQWRQGYSQRRATIGKASHLTLEEARQRARKLLVGVGDGIDPIATKARARVDDKQLFGVLAEEYFDVRVKDMRPSSLMHCRLHLQTYFMPLHRLPVAKINRAMVATELRTIVKDRGPVAANRGRSTLSAFFGWLIGEGILETNVVIGTNKSSESAGRERVLTDDELVKIWNAAPANDFGRIVKLLMLTGQRRAEIGELRWSEVEDGAIVLPKERVKNGRGHVVPLSPQAQAVLDDCPAMEGRELVFGEGEGGFSGFSAARERLERVNSVTDWTLHDLRRTVATRMADLGVQPHIIEAVLNHVSGHKAGVAGVYNRSTYTTEKRAALDLWGMHIQTLLAKANGANVTMLRKPALASGV
jgi:integrase